LVDTANRTPDDRDAKRILAAAQQAGLKKIDILLTTHFHGDHIGAMPALAKLIPIDMYMDHGESIEISRPQVAAAYKAYVELSQGKRKILQAGDRIPLKGVDIRFHIAARRFHSLKGGGPNTAVCQDGKTGRRPNPIRQRRRRILLKFGKFKFLIWASHVEPETACCPANLIGKVDLMDHASWPGPVELAAVRLVVQPRVASQWRESAVRPRFRDPQKVSGTRGHLAGTPRFAHAQGS
jgi:hypothetical protein